MCVMEQGTLSKRLCRYKDAPLWAWPGPRTRGIQAHPHGNQENPRPTLPFVPPREYFHGGRTLPNYVATFPGPNLPSVTSGARFLGTSARNIPRFPHFRSDGWYPKVTGPDTLKRKQEGSRNYTPKMFIPFECPSLASHSRTRYPRLGQRFAVNLYLFLILSKPLANRFPDILLLSRNFHGGLPLHTIEKKH